MTAPSRGRSTKYAVPPSPSSRHAVVNARSGIADLQFMYEIGVRRVPPLVHLLDTPASRLLQPRSNRRFMKFMRWSFNYFSVINRICIVVIFAMWAAPASVARIVTPIMALGSFPVLIISVVLMSAELLEQLVRQHEFWFFTFTNACNWAIASVLFNDGRVVGCIACFFLTQLVILMDANFRTVITATKSCILWVPAIAMIIVVCATRVVDIDPARFHLVIPPNKINFTLANSFLNNNTTLMIFVIRKTYRRRFILLPQFLEERVLPCSVLRCDLVLQRMRANDPDGRSRYEAYKSVREASGNDGDQEFELNVGSVAAPATSRIASSRRPTEMRVFAPVTSAPRSSRRSSVQQRSSMRTEDRTRGRGSVSLQSMMHTPTQSRLLSSSLGVRPFGSNASVASSARQRMRVITPTLAFLDLRNTLLPAWTPPKRLRVWASCLHFLCGICGLLLGGFTMYLPASRDSDTVVAVVVPATSLVCTSAFCVPFFAGCQRNMLRALSRNFDFAFSSFQFTAGTVCLADMLRWDARCFALIAWVQWFHWILMWDALLPAMRERFRFKKIYGTPVLVGIMLGLLWIVYALFFSSYDALRDRTMAEIDWGAFKISLRTSTFLVGRLNTILMWSLRLVWKAIRSEEDELVLIRGLLEYYSPMEIFPVASNQLSHVVPFDWMGTVSNSRARISEQSSNSQSSVRKGFRPPA